MALDHHFCRIYSRTHARNSIRHRLYRQRRKLIAIECDALNESAGCSATRNSCPLFGRGRPVRRTWCSRSWSFFRSSPFCEVPWCRPLVLGRLVSRYTQRCTGGSAKFLLGTNLFFSALYPRPSLTEHMVKYSIDHADPDAPHKGLLNDLTCNTSDCEILSTPDGPDTGHKCQSKRSDVLRRSMT